MRIRDRVGIEFGTIYLTPMPHHTAHSQGKTSFSTTSTFNIFFTFAQKVAA